MVSKKRVREDSVRKPKVHGKGFLNTLKRVFKGKNNILVEMTFKNGTVGHYFIQRSYNHFVLFGNTYVIDEDKKVWCAPSRVFMFRYHEGYALPYANEVSGEAFITASEERCPNIKTSFDPSVLTGVIRGEYVKSVIQGSEMSEKLRQLLFVGVACLIISGVTLIGLAFTQGWVNI